MADNKTTAERWFNEVVNEGKVDVIDELIADDFVDHDPFPGTSADVKGLKDGIEMIRSAFPDVQMSIDEAIAEGDALAIRSTTRGTHDGEFMGMPATGKKVEVAGYDIVHFEDGKVTEHWGVIDTGAMLEQLGVAPPS